MHSHINGRANLTGTTPELTGGVQPQNTNEETLIGLMLVTWKSQERK